MSRGKRAYAIYVISATVDTIDFHWQDTVHGKGMILVPEFYVLARSRKKAVKRAMRIIDPVHMTGAHIEAKPAQLNGKGNKR